MWWAVGLRFFDRVLFQIPGMNFYNQGQANWGHEFNRDHPVSLERMCFPFTCGGLVRSTTVNLMVSCLKEAHTLFGHVCCEFGGAALVK